MSATGRRWRLRGRFPDEALLDTGFPALVRHLLWHRGVRTDAEAARFVEGPAAGWVEYDPLLLPDIEAALARLRQAVRDGETVAVFGDFDVDGVTASAVLTQGLRELGARVLPYLPDRFTEGYGLNLGALERLRQAGAGLVVTADCGTSSIPEIEHAGRLGMEVVVLDHHSVPPELPAAVATVNPKRQDSRYPDPELAAAGLAYKLMAALYESMGHAWEPRRYLDLVALGTIADMAPLQNENRWLVKRGLATLAQTERPGLRALMEAAGIDPRRVDAEAVGYALAPRLNAAGRLKHARLAFELLLEEDEERARERALELTTLNQERRRQTAAALALAQELLAREDPAAPLVFVGHGQMPSGIVGLVAGRLAEERYRPAVVYEEGQGSGVKGQGGISRASCRSIPEFDITGALRQAQDRALRQGSQLMVRFGGHRAAAGFTAENEKLPALKEALLRQAGEALAGLDLTPALDIDAAVPLRRMNGQIIQWLSRLGPFGQGNPEPTFLSRDVEVADVRVVGDDGAHLRLRLREGPVTWPAIAFGLGPPFPLREGPDDLAVQAGQRLDIVYSFSADRAGEKSLELRVKDMAPAASGQSQEPRT